jgi:hypothetical protein
MTEANQVPPRTLPRRLADHGSFLAILGSGMLLRFLLAYVAFPGQGYASDLNEFGSWASVLANHGPGSFYQLSGANYPPGYMYVLWLLGTLGGPLGSIFGISSSAATLVLLKLPPMLADAAIGILLYRAGSSWFGRTAGLVAAALYLFLPIGWYDSALWGQVDAVGALLMLAALFGLVDGWSEPAVALAVLGVLVKPQDAICLVVVLPVLVRRHLLRIGSGPQPNLGRRLTTLNERLRGALTYQGPLRLVSTLVAGVLVGIVLLLPFDIERFASADLRGNLLVGHVAGLAGLFGSVANQYAVLTANAYNAWSLVGPAPLTSIAGSGGGTWTPDSMSVLWGISAAQLGTALLVVVGLTVAVGLLLRDDCLSMLLAFAVVAFAFYAVPTRVHERYLFALFPVGALLACRYGAGVLAFAGASLLNLVNLNAVLGSSRLMAGPAGGYGASGGATLSGGPSGGPPGAFVGSPGFGTGLAGSGIPGSAGIGVGGPGGSSGPATWINLPFADLARSEPVVAAVAIGQTVAFVALFVAWIAVAFGPVVEHAANHDRG